MINIPVDLRAKLNDKTGQRFQELVHLFNKLEKDLEYPNCEGYADQSRILASFEVELNNRGFL